MNKKKSYVALLSLLAMMTIVFIGCSNGGTCYEGSVYKIYGEYASVYIENGPDNGIPVNTPICFNSKDLPNIQMFEDCVISFQILDYKPIEYNVIPYMAPIFECNVKPCN